MPLSRFEQADDSPGFLLWQLTNLWQQRIRAALVPLGITHVQFVLLASAAWLEQTQQMVSQASLSRHAHTDVMMTSQVVRTLAEKGFVSRTGHPTDTRVKVVGLTPTGRAIAQQAMNVVETVDAAFFHDLGEQTATLVRLMQQVVSAQNPIHLSNHEES